MKQRTIGFGKLVNFVAFVAALLGVILRQNFAYLASKLLAIG
jgi:hypothetical protein